MKKSSKQLNQKQKQSILNASRMLRTNKESFVGTGNISVEEVPDKAKFFGRRFTTKPIYVVNGFKTKDHNKADSLKLISPSFIEEVANFLEKDPNNEYAQKITKTIIRGARFE